MNISQPIAIVGIGGIFPGTSSLQQFWHNILNSVSASREVPSGRWPVDVDDVLSTVRGQKDKVFSKYGCFVDDFALDTEGLDISNEFISKLDPLFHLAIHAGRNAYNDCKTDGIDRSRAKVIIGNIVLPSQNSSKLAMEYLGKTFDENISFTRPLSDKSSADPFSKHVAGLPGGVLAKALRFYGGSFTLDAACASSLYAVSLAADELIAGRADVVLAGGVSRPDCFYTQMGFSQLYALSQNGISAPFDMDSNGLVVGEGAGMFMLKRLEDALTAGDHIYGSIKAVGLSNDVHGSLLAPSSEGQLRAMRQAYDTAGWEPDKIDLVECHATGTPVGDAVEYASLHELWGKTGWENEQCVIGSVKSNIGHLLTAAGSAALMKVIFALKGKMLPPTANFKILRTDLEVGDTPFKLLTAPVPWNSRNPGITRKAAVSAFGFGGINAHLLIEEWIPEVVPVKEPGREKYTLNDSIDVAIIGMDTHIGEWSSLSKFRERVFDGRNIDLPYPPVNWWGSQECQWFKEKGYNENTFKGFFIDELKLPFNEFRIPPNELNEMLPQQLLMLKVAHNAIRDSRISKEMMLNSSVIIGIELDLMTTNFHFRWMVEKKAREVAKSLGLAGDSEEFKKLVNSIKESAGADLNANRTLGALGGMVASRIAREFHIGGPSFTVSGEECSGIRALETAVRLLQANKIKQAVVGAVDLAGDIRSVLSGHLEVPFSVSGRTAPFDISSDGIVPSDGAVALILKPLQDAIASDDKIYAVIKGIGTSSGAGLVGSPLKKENYKAALNAAYKEASIDIDKVDLIEASGSGQPDEDRLEIKAISEIFDGRSDKCKKNLVSSIAINSVKAAIGHSGAASGLCSVVKSALAIYHEIIPSIRDLKTEIDGYNDIQDRFYFPKTPQYWLRNRSEGERVTGVSTVASDGNCTHVVLESVADNRKRSCIEKPLLSDAFPDELFVIEADSIEDLKQGISQLQSHVNGLQSQPIKNIAQLWWQKLREKRKRKHALTLVVSNIRDLNDYLSNAYNIVSEENSTSALNNIDENRVFFSNHPNGEKGDVVFVYPGSGNHYPGMGQALMLKWPEIARLDEKTRAFLKNQFNPQLLWRDRDWNELNKDKIGIMLSQVSFGTLITNILKSAGVRPGAAIGYSLGESTSLLSLKAWKDADEIMHRIMTSRLFLHDLAGDNNAARLEWDIGENEDVNWTVGVVLCKEDLVREAVNKIERVYLLIVNTQNECVIGGDADRVKMLTKELGCKFFVINGVTIAHCNILKHVIDDYRNFHLFDVTKPEGIRFYSGAWARSYDLSSERAAGSIAAHALNGFHFPRLIENAYNDGVRTFIDIGPGASCYRMINDILKGRSHTSLYAVASKQNEVFTVLKLLAQLISERIDVNLDFLYGDGSNDSLFFESGHKEKTKTVNILVGGKQFKLQDNIEEYIEHERVIVEEKPVENITNVTENRESGENLLEIQNSMIKSITKINEANAEAHQVFLSLSSRISGAMSKNIALQLTHPGSLSNKNSSGEDVSDNVLYHSAEKLEPLFDRSKCMEFAVGKIGNVLSEDYAAIDLYPTRVRLPDEPMMFVDRILLIEGEQMTLKSGRIVTEHDVKEGSWYLDCNRIPTCVAVEAGQADLFLSAYLGIDFKTKGLAVYRLLDAVVTFYNELPVPGEVIKYDIHIDSFFRHGETYLFRFNFEATVNGKPLLSMKEGCAGFFTLRELTDGKGIIEKEAKDNETKSTDKSSHPDIVPMVVESYSEEQIDRLREGGMVACFGPLFSRLNLHNPSTIPGGKMRLVERITRVEPEGGDCGLGFIRGEADINKDDWFLVCHFVDDRVMPGTLMYECCLHTLRIYLLRMGWIGEQGSVTYQPVPDISSRLICRGQVIESTKMVAYEITIKEIGYRPEPYVICDALMFADNKAIVKIEDMSLRISGLTIEEINNIWNNKNHDTPIKKKILFNRESILAFATGKPSEAFGKQYEVFDKERHIARLPGPPYQFLDRVVEVKGNQWKMEANCSVTAEYDIPVNAWYFKENRQEVMPFAILLEIALQPCGWLAAYVGSALTSSVDLCFRNLGGTAIISKPVYCDAGTLTIHVKMTNVSTSGGMIIQNYDFHVLNGSHTVYKGTTYFGFFTRAALADQLGIRDAEIYQPTSNELERANSFSYPDVSPYPDRMLRMIDEIEFFVSDGGPKGLGVIRGTKIVNPEEWFFRAHFYQDPVCPGSLGLESFLQLLKVVAVKRWDLTHDVKLETIAVDEEHTWIYRGQVIPVDKKVTVDAVVTEIDDNKRLITADGFLSVDKRIIYQMKNFTISVSKNHEI